MYGTIVGRGNNTDSRNGFAEFIDTYKNKKIVLATDDFRDAVDKNLRDLAIIDRLDGIYCYHDMTEIPGYHGKRKDLERICSDFGIAPANSVFISDGNKDLEDAQREKVKFVHVPYYEQTNEKFSFAMIDLSKQLPKYIDLRHVNLQF